MRVWAFTASARRQAARAGIAAAVVLAMAVGARLWLPQPALAPGPTPEPVRTVPVVAKELALTFDISWGQVMPPKVVSILTRDKVSATFFLSGPWVRHNLEMVRTIAANPRFEIESHGQAHVNLSGLPAVRVTENLESANEAIEAATGRAPTMVRPPNGDYNARSLRATADLGMRTVIWGTDSLDWMNPGVGAIVSRVLGRAHPGDIVLMHASDTCKQTDLALPAILSGLRKDGYRLVTVSRLLKDAAAQLPGAGGTGRTAAS